MVTAHALDSYTAGAISSNAEITSGNLVITSKNNIAGFTGSETITVNVTTTNFGIVPVTVTLNAVDKQELPTNAIVFNGSTVTYNGSPQGLGAASVTNAGSYTGGAFNFIYDYGATGSTPPTNAGAYTVTVTVENDNYIGTATATLTINPRELTITGFHANITKVYDGNTNVTSIAPGALSFVGLVEGETAGVNVAATLPTFASANVGTHDITFGGNFGFVENGNALAINYTVVQPTGLSGTITAAPITVTPSAGQSKIFGATDPTFTFSNSGGLNALDFTGALSRQTGDDVGTYNYTLGTLSAGGNYTLSLGGSNTFAITQAIASSVDTVVNNPTAVSAYDARNATTTAEIVTLAGLPSTVTVNLQGGGMAQLGVTWGSITAFNSRGTTYEITGVVQGNTNVSGNNLMITNVQFTVTPVNAINPAFADTSVVQGTNAAATANDLGATVLPTSGNITVQGVNVPYTIVWGSQTLNTTVVGSETTFNGTISYTLPDWLSDPASLTVSRTVSVTDKTPVTISATAANTTYTGLAYTGLTGVSSGAYTGTLEYSFKGRGTTIYTASPTAPINAGDYTVTISIPASNATYIGTDSFEFTINQAPLTVTADNKTAIVGAAMPELTYTVTGMVNGESAATAIAATPSLSCTADMNTAGTYTITITGGTATANYTITNRVNGILTVNPATHTVTFNGNNGTPSETTRTVNNGAAIGKLPTASRSNHSFNGWFTAASGGTQINASTVVTGNVTYYAQWTFTGGGNNGGNNGGNQGGTTPPVQPTTPPTASTTPPTTPTPPSTIPASGGTETVTGETVNIPVTVNNETGTVTVQLDETTTNTLIEDALTKAEAQGNDAQPTVTLDLSGVAHATTAELNVYAAQAFSEAEVAVTIALPAGEITLAPEALAMLADMSDYGATPITIEAAIVPMSDLQGMQAAQVRGFETVISLDVFVGGEKIDVPLTVSLPYTLKPNENPAAVRVWHMDANGNLTCMSSAFDAATGMITFTIEHQSYFVVGYDPVALWVNIFSDVSADAWYYEAVAFANYHGLFSGYGNGIFAPNDSMTRAMFVALMHRLEGNPAPSGSNRFTDVVSGRWYHNSVQWAAEQGLVSGVGGNRFAPDRAITWQEMAVMLLRYSDFKGYEIPANREILNFSDAAQISSWASAAVQSMSAAGVLNGYNNAFNPLNTATRAEVAAMFRNFLRFVVAVNDDTDGAQPVSAATNANADIYIDRRAMEANERALAATAEGEI